MKSKKILITDYAKKSEGDTNLAVHESSNRRCLCRPHHGGEGLTHGPIYSQEQRLQQMRLLAHFRDEETDLKEAKAAFLKAAELGFRFQSKGLFWPF